MLRKIYFVMKMEQENLTRALCALHVSTKISQILFKLALNARGDSHMKQAGMLVGNFEFSP